MSTNINTAPGVYSQVIDQSFLPQQTSRISIGLVGAAERGPFDTATSVVSLKDYQNQFGGVVDGSYLPQAAGIITGLSDGATIVRVGQAYTPLSIEEASVTTQAPTILLTPVAALFSVNDYVRVRQPGIPTTVNAQVTAVTPAVTGQNPTPASLTINASMPPYTEASVDHCTVPNAYNAAEAFGSAYTYGTALTGLTVSGTRNSFTLTVIGTIPNGSLPVGSLIKIAQANAVTTREARVASITPVIGDAPALINLVTTSTSEQGFQPVALQDSYTGATVQVVTTTDGVATTTVVAHFMANTAGTWANSDGITTGLIVKVAPGSNPDTKQLQVYLDSALAETIDNLVFTNPADPNYAETRINGNSATLQVTVVSNDEPPANTLAGWGSSSQVNNMFFVNGFNGENVTSAAFIGVDDPDQDGGTGMRAFNDVENIAIDFLCCPGRTEVDTLQEGATIALGVNAQLIGDIPDGLNLRQAADWADGIGLYTGQGQLNTYAASLFWNWFSLIDPLDGNEKFVPPSLAALRCLAYTFDNYRPWYAAAGENRGVVVEATGVRYTKTSLTDRNATYRNGQCVNPILVSQGTILVYGDETTQRADSKLSSIHCVTLVNYTMRNLAILARQFVFDPNDAVLLSQIQSVFDQFLKGVQNDRGLEGYSLVVNATAAQRNARDVEVDLALIPIDAVETIQINATVNSSGATLNNVTTSS